MTLKQVFNEALKLLGYQDREDGFDNDNIDAKMLTIGNAVFAELQAKNEPFKRISSVTEEIPLQPRVIADCMVYGVAMWIALQNSDGDNQIIFSNLYEQKKHNLTKQGFVKDVFLK